MTVGKTGVQAQPAEPMPDYDGLTWTIVIENRSAQTATVQFVDQLPDDIFGTPVVIPATVVYNAGARTLTWNGVLPPGGSITITVNIILALGNPPQCRTIPNPSYTVTVNGVASPPVTNSAPVQIGPCGGGVTPNAARLSGAGIKRAEELASPTATASAAPTPTLAPTPTGTPPLEPTAAPQPTGAPTAAPQPTGAPTATLPPPASDPPAPAPPATPEPGTAAPTTAPPATEMPTDGTPAIPPELPQPTEAVGPYPAPPAATTAPAVTAQGFGGGALAPYLLVATVILALFRRR